MIDLIKSLPQDPVQYAIPVFMLIILIEVLLSSSLKRHLYEGKDSFANLAMGTGSVFIAIAVKIVAFMAMKWVHQFALFDIGFVWWAWVLLFFLEDFSFYWHHRLSHEVRILWAAHVNHHSSEHLNYTVALRQSWTELLYKYIFWMWLPLVGFEPVMILTLMSVNLIFQFITHTQLVGKLGPLEWIFNTPSHHRVHHASNIKYLDRNHAGTLIIWDRLFGTFQEEDEQEKPKFGITNNIHTFNPLKIASHEFIAIWHDVQRADKFSDKLKYIFYPPGWSHDGPDQTAKYLQKKLKSS